MAHDHLFNFSLTKGYKCFGCIYTADWDVSLKVDSDIAQKAKMQEQIHSDQSMLSEIAWMLPRIMLAEQQTTLYEGRDTALDCSEKY